MNGSKWTWLRDKCIELGYIKSAKVAQHIEDVLHRLYDITNTTAWMEVEEDIINECFELDPFEIIEDPLFCCACDKTLVSMVGCYECLFGKEVGICDADTSLYRKFHETFKTESQKK